MPDSQNPEHTQKLIEEFQLKGQNLIPTVTGEIVPTVLVADLTSVGPQARDRLAQTGRILAASGAGNINTIWFSNPAGSAVLAVLEQFWINPEANDQIDLILNQDLVTVTAGAWRDSRLSGQPVCGTGGAAVAAAVLGVQKYSVLALESLVFEGPWVLAPGNSIRIRQQNQNETLEAGFLWRERDVLPSD